MAWKPLGWKAAWYAEIEKFPSRVLAARHPETPNLGDMTKLHESEVFNGSALDVLVGGTPCQSFSVAGLRKGLADPRGNLALVFLGLIDRKRPRWVVWENVPGVLSSWSDAEDGQADADVAGGSGDLFGGLDGRGDPGGARHEDVEQTNDFDTFLCGLSELGYGVAWAVLDAQYFGVPQRRERVFVVAHLGDAGPASAVLVDRHCLCGHPAPGRTEGEEVAGTLRAGSGGGCGPGPDEAQQGHLVAKPLLGHHHRRDADTETFVAHTLTASHDASPDGTGRGTPIVPVTPQIAEVAHPLRAEGHDAIDNGEGKTNLILDKKPVPVDITNARLGSDDVSGTLEAAMDRGNRGQGVLAPKPAAPAVFDMRGNGDGDNAPTLTGHHAGAVSDFSPMVFEPRFVRNGRGAPSHVVPPLKAQSGETGKGDAAPVIFEPRHFTRGMGGKPSEVCPTLKTHKTGGAGDAEPVVFTQNSRSEVREIGGDGQITGAVAADAGAQQQNYLLNEDAVRRLTPRECERLQGFPDDYTLIPGGNRVDDEDYIETVEYLLSSGFPVKEALELADTPDGPRYKACGNSMAVPVMAWIGRRIAEVDAILKALKKKKK